MTLATVVETSRPRIAIHSGVALFNNLGIYHFCIAFFVIDTLDVIDSLGFSASSNLITYMYAGIVIGLMMVSFVRWRLASPTIGQIIFLGFFILTGVVFAINFFFYDIRESYISAFIAPLFFSAAMFF